MPLIILFALAFAIAGRSDETWRSKLYPENWNPGFKDKEGRFLHDFSYAGYHQGKKKPGAPKNLKTFNAKDFKSIAEAISAAEKNNGGIVRIPSGLYRIDKPLWIKKSNIIIKGDGPEKTKLYFTAHKKMTGKAHITFMGALKQSKYFPLATNGAPLSCFVRLKSVKGLKKGMHITLGFVITDAFRKEHGMLNYWLFAKDKWRAFFRRKIIKINEAENKIFFNIPLRYPLKTRDKASLRIETGHLSECGIQDLSIATAAGWDEAWANNRSHAIAMIGVRNCWIDNIHSFSSPLKKAKGYHLQSCGIIIRNSKMATVSNCVFSNPQHRGGGGNGYLFEIGQSCEIMIRDCEGINGRHNFIQNWDFSTNGCVFLRIKSTGSWGYKFSWDPVGWPAASEFHHALAMANLIDDSEINDGWFSRNRGNWSSKAGHTSTENVLWNIQGRGQIISKQYGWGYLIGTGEHIKISRSNKFWKEDNSEPDDYLEGIGKAKTISPKSLYEDQLKRRLCREPK